MSKIKDSTADVIVVIALTALTVIFIMSAFMADDPAYVSMIGHGYTWYPLIQKTFDILGVKTISIIGAGICTFINIFYVVSCKTQNKSENKE